MDAGASKRNLRLGGRNEPRLHRYLMRHSNASVEIVGAIVTLFLTTIHQLGPRILDLVLTSINTVTYVGSATNVRSRRDDESMPGHRRGGTTRKWRSSRPNPKGDGEGGRSLCHSSSTMPLHRLLLFSRPRLAFPLAYVTVFMEGST